MRKTPAHIKHNAKNFKPHSLQRENKPISIRNMEIYKYDAILNIMKYKDSYIPGTNVYIMLWQLGYVIKTKKWEFLIVKKNT